jgi:hypothetical protein
MARAQGEFAGSARFTVLRRLGEGGMGVVYEAEDRERGLRVALKTFHGADSDTIFRLKREFRALADLSHPNLAALYDLVVDPSGCFFTMELLEGTDFLAWVAPVTAPRRSTEMLAYAETQTTGGAGGGVAPEAARSTLPMPLVVPRPVPRHLACDESRLRLALPQLGQGLCALHAAGKIHRDIKPSNVRVTPAGRVVLLDFGLVAEVGEVPVVDGVVGTVAYMAPEQAAGDRRLSPAADWYAVGVMLYQALTGRLPFEGRALEVLEAKQRLEPGAPRAWVPDVPRDLDELCLALLARDPVDRPGGGDVLRRLGVADDSRVFITGVHHSRETRLAGREAELAGLEASLDVVAGGRAAAVLVRGPSGIGKSTLVGRFLERARTREVGALVLKGRCYEHEAVPYRALDGLIDHLSHDLSQRSPDEVAALVPRDAALLPTLFPVLGRVRAIADAPSPGAIVDQHEVRARAYAALRELLRALAARQPLILFLDDLQWCDVDTAALLAHVMHPPDPPPLLLLLCTRPEGSEKVVVLLGRLHAERRQVELGPLGAGAAEALVKEHLPDAAPELVARVVAEAGGSPFFLLELLRFMEGRELAEVAGKGLEAVLAERLQRLGAEARAVAEVVAVAGEPITMRIAGLAAGLAADDLRRHMSLLRSQRVVRAAGGRADDEVEPYHDRVREALLAGLADERRARHHRGLATALTGQAPADRLARHWHGAGEPERAAEHSWRAADEAQKTLDFERAAGFYQMALELGRFDDETRRRLRVALAAAFADAGRPMEAARAFETAAATASATEALELRRRAADALLRGGYVDEGLAATRAVLDRYKLTLAGSPRRALARLLVHRARLRLRGLGWTPRPLPEISQEDLTRVDVIEGVAMGLAMVDAFRAGEYCARFILAALELGEPKRVGRALALEADLQASLGHEARARQLAAELETLTARDPSPQAQAQLMTTQGMLAFFCDNRFRRALELLERATAIFKAHERRAGFEINIVGLFICWARQYVGELAELARRVPVMAEAAERQGDRFMAVNLRTAFPIVRLIAGEVDEAEAEVDEALATWGPRREHLQMQDVFAAVAHVDVALYRGRVAAGAERFAEVQAGLRKSMLHLLPANQLLLLSAASRLAMARGAAAPPGSSERTAAAREAERAVRALVATRQPAVRGFVPLIRASAAHLAGDDETCVRILRETLPELDALEFGAFAHPVRKRLARLVGGSEGAALDATADAWFAAQGVKDPERLLAVLAPGYER